MASFNFINQHSVFFVHNLIISGAFQECVLIINTVHKVIFNQMRVKILFKLSMVKQGLMAPVKFVWNRFLSAYFGTIILVGFITFNDILHSYSYVFSALSIKFNCLINIIFVVGVAAFPDFKRRLLKVMQICFI